MTYLPYKPKAWIVTNFVGSKLTLSIPVDPLVRKVRPFRCKMGYHDWVVVEIIHGGSYNFTIEQCRRAGCLAEKTVSVRV